METMLGSALCFCVGVDRSVWPKPTAAERYHARVANLKDLLVIGAMIAGIRYLGRHSAPFENMPQVNRIP